jgi:hypothetical protein
MRTKKTVTAFIIHSLFFIGVSAKPLLVIAVSMIDITPHVFRGLVFYGRPLFFICLSHYRFKVIEKIKVKYIIQFPELKM